MANKKCKRIGEKDLNTKEPKDHKYRCKKCHSTSNKEKKLCKPVNQTRSKPTRHEVKN